MLLLRQRAAMHAPQKQLETRIHIKYKYKLKYRYKIQIQIKTQKYNIYKMLFLQRASVPPAQNPHGSLSHIPPRRSLLDLHSPHSGERCFRRYFCDSIMNNICNALNYEKL